MVIVLSGATSFLGQSLINELAKNKNNLIYCLIRNESKNKIINKFSNVIIIDFDLRDFQEDFFPLQQADVFFHFGWLGSGPDGRKNKNIQFSNINISKRILNIAKKIGVKEFVFSGSQAEYGKLNYVIEENISCNPISYYGKAKVEFDEYAKDFCLNNNISYLHLRIFSVYGKGDHSSSLVSNCIRIFNNGGEIKLGPCTQLWNYLFIDDFTTIVIKLMIIFYNNIIQDVINIASNDTIPLRDYINRMYKCSLKKGSFIFSDYNPNPEGIVDLNPSISKMISYIGEYNFITFENGLKKMKEN